MNKANESGSQEAECPPGTQGSPGGTQNDSERPRSGIRSISLQGQTESMAKMAGGSAQIQLKKTHVGPPGWGGYKIPKRQTGGDPRLEGLSSSDDGSEGSDEEMDTRSLAPQIFGSPGPCGLNQTISSQTGPAATWTPTASAGYGFTMGMGQSRKASIGDSTIYDPLAAETPEIQLAEGQWAFLGKYFHDPEYKPELLDTVEAECPIPEAINQWVRRPMDQEILDLMPQNAQDWASQQDKAFMSVGSRLGTAVGPLLKVWNNWREVRSSLGPDTSEDDRELVEGSCKAVEQSLIALGQVQGAILYQRRVALLTRFFRDGKKAKEVVTKNAEIFPQAEEAMLFGKTYHRALYCKARRSKHLSEA